MPTRVMTYEEIAAAFGISLDSARRTVRRKRWSKAKGNDGTARIEVPVDAIPAPKDSPKVNPADTPKDSPQDRPKDNAEAIRTLIAVIDSLREENARLTEKVSERDTLAAQLDALRSLFDAEKRMAEEALVAERRRADELREERNRWAVQAHALAHPPALPAPAPTPPRGLLGWLRAARR